MCNSDMSEWEKLEARVMYLLAEPFNNILISAKWGSDTEAGGLLRFFRGPQWERVRNGMTPSEYLNDP
ncbi:hypothetical protein BC938DRAFT_470672 [Jimgerdemannia flammicorona]|uniref:Uncharacterized protein n=1 Tax=Jimgerdemannia flammicorona TaxID=994334 RepID=A0A433R019_9FUNG|nr:hypothetical protein BC938DRAFT_470672 [Jimgerdemannia flammicorona]